MSRHFPRLADLNEMTPRQQAEFRSVLFHNFSFFVDYVFWLRESAVYVWTSLHVIMVYVLHAIDGGYYSRVIFNAPPRMGKSELVTRYWPAWHFLREPRCNFIEISYSKDLIYEMSSDIQDIIQLPEMMFLFGTTLRKDTTAKGLWRTPEGGGLRAAPSKGQITGFGAGRYGWKKFGGAIVISDPVKPADARSLPIMEAVNTMFNSTTRNRVNDERTPIVIEAQRLADNDLSGFLLGGGSGERWLHVRIPAKIDADDLADAEERYRLDWNYGDPLELRLPYGFVWEEKYGEERDSQLSVTPDIRNAQYMQNPRIVEGAFFSPGWFRRYDEIDVDTGFHGVVLRNKERVKIMRLEIFADTAQKKGRENDYSVFQLWGLGEDGDIYMIDQIRGKWEAPELEDEAKRFMRRYADRRPRRYGWRNINIEDKSSGTGLIQYLKKETDAARINPIGRSIDKVSRAYGIVPYVHGGHVWIPKKAHWVAAYLKEFQEFSKYDTHAHDDQIDATMDAVETLLPRGRSVYDAV